MPSKQNANAHALSQAPVDQVITGDELGESLPSFLSKIAMIRFIGTKLSMADPTVDPVLEKIATAIDRTKLKNKKIAGFPNDKYDLGIDLVPSRV